MKFNHAQPNPNPNRPTKTTKTKLFVEFLKDRTDENRFTLHKLYNKESLEESIDAIQISKTRKS